MTLWVKNGGYAFLIRFNVFYVIMKGVANIANFRQPIYQTFDSTNLI